VVTEPVEAWWARRQRSKGASVPYAIGTYRPDWERYPVLIRQYHPDLNRGITLTQIPPAADVWLQWQCDAGHRFVATPEEQRARPGRSRRRSTWCPQCALLATGKPSSKAQAKARAKLKPLCQKSRAPEIEIGDAFLSDCAPRAASAAEPRLRQLLAARLEFDVSPNAVRVSRPFFSHLEVWPDIIVPELRVAIEYDTTGRDGLEHVGDREGVDRRKDRMLRTAGWEVIRVRCGKLQPLGPYDIVAPGVSAALIDRLLDRLREVRGDLIVDCFLR
jgi:Probable Zinc-ribbon domain